MIPVTRLNGEEVYVNADRILFLERSPETVITLDSGRKIMVKESIEDVLQKIAEFKKRCWPSVWQGEGVEHGGQ